ncbi:hypothetical protein [Mobilicoccus caccae]|uniref:VapC45 PIN like domain-containing protein n=1 Tax=Mobilicoccus caccae TaxID=1859295 RepID=A0ABQ6IVR8_9MICO|nr:hypothetical protein [Mobilicoccus caccae]GMA41541.1 hypothetical protein GCM10025883_35860 [Mobilicoccus caccae]
MYGRTTFFVDRSLGRRIVPLLLREAGWSIEIHDEVFVGRAESVSDEEWLTLAGGEGWAVLMKDTRIRYRSSERQALIAARVHAFCLTRGDLAGPQAASVFLRHQPYIEAAVRRPTPSLHLLSQNEARDIDDIRER